MLPPEVEAALRQASVINAGGPFSAYGGSRPSAAVIEAMAVAHGTHADISELNRRVGAHLATHLGVPACLVTAGAMNAVVLAMAGVITGGPGSHVPRADGQLARTHPVAIQRHHMDAYSCAYEIGGGTLVPIGSDDRCDPADLAAALDGGAVAVAHLAHPAIPDVGISLSVAADLAARHGVPTIVDAAATPGLECMPNLLADGAALVAISGGKGLRGPQHSGLLVGEEDLIEAARSCASPHAGLGRQAKITRDAIVGVHVAVLEALARDHVAERAAVQQRADDIGKVLAVPAVQDRFDVLVAHDPEFDAATVTVRARPGAEADVAVLLSVRAALLAGDPAIFMRHRSEAGGLVVLPESLTDAEAEIVATRLLGALVAVTQAS